MKHKIPEVAHNLFDGFGRFDESINGLRSNCNEIVTQILETYQVDNLVIFNYDVDIELKSILDMFQPFYDRIGIQDIVGNYFKENFVDMKSQLSSKVDELLSYIDNNEKAYPCYVSVSNDSISKMFVASQKDIIIIADVISKSIKDESINFQNSVAVTISTMRSDLNSCLVNESTTVSCLNDYVSICFDNYLTNLISYSKQYTFSGQR